MTNRIETFDHPVWECDNCGKIHHTLPPATEAVWGKNKWGTAICIAASRIFCDDCGGNITRAYHRIPLATSVRPLPHLKGQNRYNMVRYCCWNCGKGTDICISVRAYWYSWGSRKIIRKIDTCPICGKENRMEVQEY